MLSNVILKLFIFSRRWRRRWRRPRRAPWGTESATSTRWTESRRLCVRRTCNVAATPLRSPSRSAPATTPASAAPHPWSDPASRPASPLQPSSRRHRRAGGHHPALLLSILVILTLSWALSLCVCKVIFDSLHFIFVTETITDLLSIFKRDGAAAGNHKKMKS